jgi:ribosome maturation factor RimP
MLVAETGKMAEIARMIAPSLEAMGYDVVRVRMTGGGRPVLQVMAERLDGQEMTVDHCAEISRAVSALLDVEDPIAGAYVLEVSSPGIDRPLTRLNDFVRFAGHEAKLEVGQPVDGRKRFRGRLVGLEGDQLRVATEDGDRLLPVAEIRSAKLVLSDSLIADATKRQNRQ